MIRRWEERDGLRASMTSFMGVLASFRMPGARRNCRRQKAIGLAP
jgi:hypothetical protein